jgi:hypothetical protein
MVHMRSLRTDRLRTFGLVLLATLVAVGAAAPHARGAVVNLVAVAEPAAFKYGDPAANAPIVRPLDDPANPWVGQYSALDRWAYAHFASPDRAEALLAAPAADAAPPVLSLAVPVNASGWPIPLVEYERLKAAASDRVRSEDQGRTVLEYYQCHKKGPYDLSLDKYSPTEYFYIAAGPADPALAAEAEALQVRSKAERYPAIPAWLGEAPPLAAVFLPEAEILTCGELGERYQPDPPGQYYGSRDWQLGDPWRRYSASGELLETRQPAVTGSRSWMQLWSPAIVSAYPYYRGTTSTWTETAPGVLFIIEWGLSNISPYTPESPNDRLEAFGWDGRKLGWNNPMPLYPPGVGELIEQDELGQIYRAHCPWDARRRRRSHPLPGSLAARSLPAMPHPDRGRSRRPTATIRLSWLGPSMRQTIRGVDSIPSVNDGRRNTLARPSRPKPPSSLPATVPIALTGKFAPMRGYLRETFPVTNPRQTIHTSRSKCRLTSRVSCCLSAPPKPGSWLRNCG